MTGINSEQKVDQEVATLGSGCFWCTEAVFRRIRGVERVESGYSGGDVENPSYEQVSAGTTGHAEVVQISFDPKAITYEEILEIFFSTRARANSILQSHFGADLRVPTLMKIPLSSRARH